MNKLMMNSMFDSEAKKAQAAEKREQDKYVYKPRNQYDDSFECVARLNTFEDYQYMQ